MSSSCKLCVEEFIKTLAACFFVYESTREDDDIGIVVLTYKMSYFWLPYESGANLLMLV